MKKKLKLLVIVFIAIAGGLVLIIGMLLFGYYSDVKKEKIIAETFHPNGFLP